MRLYYTASQPEERQAKLSLSIGGYKSAVPVSNDVFGNMFSDITMYTVKMGVLKSFLGLVLKNETAAVLNLDIWVVVPANCYSKYKLSAVDMATDSDGNPFMERVSHNGARPLYAEFVSADGEPNKLNIGAIAAGECVGLWIERELDLDIIKDDQNKIYEKDNTNPYRYVELELAKSDSIEFHIEF